jgi:hypothetical protein
MPQLTVVVGLRFPMMDDIVVVDDEWQFQTHVVEEVVSVVQGACQNPEMMKTDNDS